MVGEAGSRNAADEAVLGRDPVGVQARVEAGFLAGVGVVDVEGAGLRRHPRTR